MKLSSSLLFSVGILLGQCALTIALSPNPAISFTLQLASYRMQMPPKTENTGLTKSRKTDAVIIGQMPSKKGLVFTMKNPTKPGGDYIRTMIPSGPRYLYIQKASGHPGLFNLRLGKFPQNKKDHSPYKFSTDTCSCGGNQCKIDCILPSLWQKTKQGLWGYALSNNKKVGGYQVQYWDSSVSAPAEFDQRLLILSKLVKK